MKKLNVLILLFTVLLLAACGTSKKTINDEEAFAPLDEVIKVQPEELTLIVEEMFRVWREHATRLKEGNSNYSLEEYGILTLCDDYIAESDFDMNIGDEIIDYYVELRETETINDANKELKESIERSFDKEWEVEMYMKFVDLIKVNSSLENINFDAVD